MPVTLSYPVAMLLLVLFAFSPAHADELATPSCEDLAAWSGSVDPKARWEPFSENRRLWLPEAMAQPAFADLFGKPAVEWTQADVASARATWNGCIQKAKKARDRDQQKLLQDARRYLTSNLRGVARYQERRGQRVTRDQAVEARQAREVAEREAARRAESPSRAAVPVHPVRSSALQREVDQLIKAPASVNTLIALGSLSRLDLNDAETMQNLEKQFGYSSGPAASPAYSILRDLRIRGPQNFDEVQRPRIDERLVAVKPEAFAQFRDEFSQTPTDMHQRRALAQRYEKTMKQLEYALTPSEYQSLADTTRNERRAAVDSVIDAAKSKIDQVLPGADGIAQIDRIVRDTTQRGLDIRQRRALSEHAVARQRVLANEVLREATENQLPALPPTLAGIRSLNAISTRMLQGIVQKADRDVIQRFVDTSDARLTEIGRKALPEYEQALAKLPVDEKGLAQAEREIADKEGWTDMEEGVRGEYVAIARARRDEIAGVVSEQRAQQREALERERKAAIAAGGDPRLVGSEWVDTNKTMKFEFRDEETVFINALGIKAAGTYEVSRNDVVVKGPHGQLVYTLNGDRLTGMGATFIRQPD